MRQNVREDCLTVALAGNPNVGKSTLFNRLTGLNQHTGNWPGKTVGAALGQLTYKGSICTLVDTPGAYSLFARSAEEEAARDYICFGGADRLVIICDATCLRRNLILVLQALELTGDVVVCVNLLDEARKKGVFVDIPALSKRLGVPVCGIIAGTGEGVDALLDTVHSAPNAAPREPVCDVEIQIAAQPIIEMLERRNYPLPSKWLALRLLEGDESMLAMLKENLDISIDDAELSETLETAKRKLEKLGISDRRLSDMEAERIVRCAVEVCDGIVTEGTAPQRDRKIDKILTHRYFGYPVMIALLALILWLTIAGANVPSQLLATGLFRLGDLLSSALELINAPTWLSGVLIDGAYKTLAWVVAVMLPPMAIFFPLFTLLEDLGYLPRVAFNLDGFFKKCSACGKQGLTMCMECLNLYQ